MRKGEVLALTWDDFDENALLSLDKREIPTFVMNFTKYVSAHDIKLTEKIKNRFSDKVISEFERTDTKNFMQYLQHALTFWKSTYHMQPVSNFVSLQK